MLFLAEKDAAKVKMQTNLHPMEKSIFVPFGPQICQWTDEVIDNVTLLQLQMVRLHKIARTALLLMLLHLQMEIKCQNQSPVMLVPLL